MYILVATIAGAILAYSWWRELTPVKVALLFVSFAIIASGDWVLFGIFRMYEYRPYLVRNPQVDGYLGELLADFMLVPFLASALLGNPRIRRSVIWGQSAVMLLLEILFARLGLFTLTGWSHWYTALGFPLYYLLLATWAGRFEREGYTWFHRLLIVYAMIQMAWHTTGLVAQRVLRLGTFLLWGRPDTDPWMILSTGLLFAMPLTVSGMLWVWRRWFARWTGSALFTAGWVTWLSVLYGLDLFTNTQPWVPVLIGGMAGGLVYAVNRLDGWFARRMARRRPIPPWLPP